jgi:DNA-binding MarR family transcriptional regulator
VADEELSEGRALGAFARQLHRERRIRDAAFPAELFGEAVWDILLDLFASGAEERKVRVSSACIAACVPASTALRYLSEMERRGLIVRSPSPDDKRGQYIALSEVCQAEMRELLARLQTLRSVPPSSD